VSIFIGVTIDRAVAIDQKYEQDSLDFMKILRISLLHGRRESRLVLVKCGLPSKTKITQVDYQMIRKIPMNQSNYMPEYYGLVLQHLKKEN